MKKIMKTVCGAAACVSVLACTVACISEDAAGPGMEDFMSRIEITGTVYDFDTKDGVADMMVILTSYDFMDTGYAYPVHRDTAYSGGDGTYSIVSRSMSNGWNFRVTVKDNVPDREGGNYSASSSDDPVIHVEFNEHIFDSEAGIFRIGPIDIAVSR